MDGSTCRSQLHQRLKVKGNQELRLTSGHTVKYRLQIESLVTGQKSSVAYSCI